MPFSICLTMFSSMTMASSTTKPTDSVSASSVMLLMEKSSMYMVANVPHSEIGTASAGMKVAEAERRNRKITRITRPMAISRVSSTSLTDCLIETERSMMTSIFTDGGICARSIGSFASTPSTTATVLASGCL